MVSGVIGITAKIIVTCFNTIIMREKDESMGFNMWKLSKRRNLRYNFIVKAGAIYFVPVFLALFIFSH